jgi:predicted NAD/FAD-dependent oxidoreductase
MHALRIDLAARRIEGDVVDVVGGGRGLAGRGRRLDGVDLRIPHQYFETRHGAFRLVVAAET